MASLSNKRGLLIVLVGPSGVGKSTISRALAERMHLKYIASATTRPKTEKDDEGKTYDYMDEPTFFKKLEGGEFLEYAAVWDQYYGTPKHPTLDYLANGDDVLLEIDVQGAMQVRFQYPDALMIFIMPPDEKSLQHRLRTIRQAGQRARLAHHRCGGAVGEDRNAIGGLRGGAGHNGRDDLRFL